jgi:hypothetical protein
VRSEDLSDFRFFATFFTVEFRFCVPDFVLFERVESLADCFGLAVLREKVVAFAFVAFFFAEVFASEEFTEERCGLVSLEDFLV